VVAPVTSQCRTEQDTAMASRQLLSRLPDKQVEMHLALFGSPGGLGTATGAGAAAGLLAERLRHAKAVGFRLAQVGAVAAAQQLNVPGVVQGQDTRGGAAVVCQAGTLPDRDTAIHRHMAGAAAACVLLQQERRLLAGAGAVVGLPPPPPPLLLLVLVVRCTIKLVAPVQSVKGSGAQGHLSCPVIRP